MQLLQMHHLGKALFVGPGCGSSSEFSRVTSCLAKSKLPHPLFMSSTSKPSQLFYVKGINEFLEKQERRKAEFTVGITK